MTSGERGSQPSRLYVTWHRSVADSLDHAVTDEDLADSIALQTGRYDSLCGREVPFDSCLVPPGRRCRACNVLVRLRTTPPTTERTCHRKPSRWRRLLGCFQTPAVLPPRPPQRVRLIPEQGGRTTTSAGTGGNPDRARSRRSPRPARCPMTVRLIIARPLPGTVGESRRVVHVFPVPTEETTPERLTAYCGAAFGPGELELLERPAGIPCVTCLRRAPVPESAEQPTIEQ